MSNISSDLAGLRGEHAIMGRSIFAGDISLPGMLHACLLAGPQARGRISGIDFKEALKAPGVVAAVADQGLLGVEIDYLGQPVAAICAETAQAAVIALGRIKYEFAAQEPLFELELAMADGAPSLLDGGNVVSRANDEKGDVENALSQASQVVMARFQTAPRSLAGVEPAVCVAAHEPDGGLILYANRGRADVQHGALAAALDMDQAKLRIECLGDAPAGPWETAMQYAALSLAIKSGRAVRIAPSLAENVAHGLRVPGTVILGRAGVDDKGRLTALDLDISVDGGANQAKLDQAVAMAGAFAYSTDNFRCRVSRGFTNTPPAEVSASCIASAVHFAVEGLLNESARQLAMDPVEMRQANVAPGGTLAQCLESAKKSALWDGGKQTGAACFVFGDGAEIGAGVQLVRAETDLETGMITLSSMQAIISGSQPSDAAAAQSRILAQLQDGVSAALVSGLKTVEGKVVNAAEKHHANSLDMPRVKLEFTGNGPAPEITAGPSYGVAPALAASVAAASGGFCTQLPITPEGLLKATGRIR